VDEEVLNQTRFFSKCDQMIDYVGQFYTKIVLLVKLMDFLYFARSGLDFHHHLQFQILEQFVYFSTMYYENLIKIFYSNLKVMKVSHLYSEVNKISIKIKYANWLIVVNMNIKDKKLSFLKILEEL